MKIKAFQAHSDLKPASPALKLMANVEASLMALKECLAPKQNSQQFRYLSGILSLKYICMAQ